MSTASRRRLPRGLGAGVVASSVELGTTQGAALDVGFGLFGGARGSAIDDVRIALGRAIDYYKEYSLYIVRPGEALGRPSRLVALAGRDFTRPSDVETASGIKLTAGERFEQALRELIDRERAQIDRAIDFEALRSVAAAFARNVERTQEYFWTFECQGAAAAKAALPRGTGPRNTNGVLKDDPSSNAEVLVRARTFGSSGAVARYVLPDDDDDANDDTPWQIRSHGGTFVLPQQRYASDGGGDGPSILERRDEVAEAAGGRVVIFLPSSGIVDLMVGVRGASEAATDAAVRAVRAQVKQFEALAANLAVYARFERQLRARVREATNAHTGTWRLYTIDRAAVRRNRVRDRRAWLRMIDAHVHVDGVREFASRVEGGTVRVRVNALHTHTFVPNAYRYLRYALNDPAVDRELVRHLNWRVCRYVRFLRENARSASAEPVPYVLDPALLFEREADAAVGAARRASVDIGAVRDFTATADSVARNVARLEAENTEAQAEIAAIRALGPDLNDEQRADIARIGRKIDERSRAIDTERTRAAAARRRIEDIARAFAGGGGAAVSDAEIAAVQAAVASPLVGIALTRTVADFAEVRTDTRLRIALAVSNALAGVDASKRPGEPGWLEGGGNDAPTYANWAQVAQRLNGTLFVVLAERERRGGGDAQTFFRPVLNALYLEYNVKYAEPAQRSLDFVHDATGAMNGAFGAVEKARAATAELVARGDEPAYGARGSPEAECGVRRRRFDVATVLSDSAARQRDLAQFALVATRPATAARALRAPHAEQIVVGRLRQGADEGSYIVQQYRTVAAPGAAGAPPRGVYATRGVHHVDVYDSTVANVLDAAAPTRRSAPILSTMSTARPNSAVLNLAATPRSAVHRPTPPHTLRLPMYADRVRSLRNVAEEAIAGDDDNAARLFGVEAAWFFFTHHSIVSLYDTMRAESRVDAADAPQRDVDRYAAPGAKLRPLWNAPSGVLLERAHADGFAHSLAIGAPSVFDNGVYVAVERAPAEASFGGDNGYWLQPYGDMQVRSVFDTRFDLPVVGGVDTPADRRLALGAYAPHRAVAAFELRVAATVLPPAVAIAGDAVRFDVRPHVRFGGSAARIEVDSVQWRYEAGTEHGGVTASRTVADLPGASARATAQSTDVLERAGAFAIDSAHLADSGRYVCRVHGTVSRLVAVPPRVRAAAAAAAALTTTTTTTTTAPNAASPAVADTGSGDSGTFSIVRDVAFDLNVRVDTDAHTDATLKCARCGSAFTERTNAHGVCMWHTHPPLVEAFETHVRRAPTQYPPRTIVARFYANATKEQREYMHDVLDALADARAGPKADAYATSGASLKLGHNGQIVDPRARTAASFMHKASRRVAMRDFFGALLHWAKGARMPPNSTVSVPVDGWHACATAYTLAAVTVDNIDVVRGGDGGAGGPLYACTVSPRPSMPSIDTVTWAYWTNFMEPRVHVFATGTTGIGAGATARHIVGLARLHDYTGPAPTALRATNADYSVPSRLSAQIDESGGCAIGSNVTVHRASDNTVTMRYGPMLAYGTSAALAVGADSGGDAVPRWRCCNRPMVGEGSGGCWVGRHSAVNSDPDLRDAFSTLSTERVAADNARVARAAATHARTICARGGLLYGDGADGTQPRLSIFGRGGAAASPGSYALKLALRPSRGTDWRGSAPTPPPPPVPRTQFSRRDGTTRATAARTLGPFASAHSVYAELLIEDQHNRLVGGCAQFPWRNFVDAVASYAPNAVVVARDDDAAPALRSDVFTDAVDDGADGLDIETFDDIVQRYMGGTWAEPATTALPTHTNAEEADVVGDILRVLASAHATYSPAAEAGAVPVDLTSLPNSLVWHIDAEQGYHRYGDHDADTVASFATGQQQRRARLAQIAKLVAAAAAFEQERERRAAASAETRALLALTEQQLLERYAQPLDDATARVVDILGAAAQRVADLRALYAAEGGFAADSAALATELAQFTAQLRAATFEPFAVARRSVEDAARAFGVARARYERGTVPLAASEAERKAAVDEMRAARETAVAALVAVELTDRLAAAERDVRAWASVYVDAARADALQFVARRDRVAAALPVAIAETARRRMGTATTAAAVRGMGAARLVATLLLAYPQRALEADTDWYYVQFVREALVRALDDDAVRALNAFLEGVGDFGASPGAPLPILGTDDADELVRTLGAGVGNAAADGEVAAATLGDVLRSVAPSAVGRLLRGALVPADDGDDNDVTGGDMAARRAKHDLDLAVATVVNLATQDVRATQQRIVQMSRAQLAAFVDNEVDELVLPARIDAVVAGVSAARDGPLRTIYAVLAARGALGAAIEGVAEGDAGNSLVDRLARTADHPFRSVNTVKATLFAKLERAAVRVRARLDELRAEAASGSAADLGALERVAEQLQLAIERFDAVDASALPAAQTSWLRTARQHYSAALPPVDGDGTASDAALVFTLWHALRTGATFVRRRRAAMEAMARPALEGAVRALEASVQAEAERERAETTELFDAGAIARAVATGIGTAASWRRARALRDLYAEYTGGGGSGPSAQLEAENDAFERTVEAALGAGIQLGGFATSAADDGDSGGSAARAAATAEAATAFGRALGAYSDALRRDMATAAVAQLTRPGDAAWARAFAFDFTANTSAAALNRQARELEFMFGGEDDGDDAGDAAVDAIRVYAVRGDEARARVRAIAASDVAKSHLDTTLGVFGEAAAATFDVVVRAMATNGTGVARNATDERLGGVVAFYTDALAHVAPGIDGGAAATATTTTTLAAQPATTDAAFATSAGVAVAGELVTAVDALWPFVGDVAIPATQAHDLYTDAIRAARAKMPSAAAADFRTGMAQQLRVYQRVLAEFYTRVDQDRAPGAAVRPPSFITTTRTAGADTAAAAAHDRAVLNDYASIGTALPPGQGAVLLRYARALDAYVALRTEFDKFAYGGADGDEASRLLALDNYLYDDDDDGGGDGPLLPLGAIVTRKSAVIARALGTFHNESFAPPKYPQGAAAAGESDWVANGALFRYYTLVVHHFVTPEAQRAPSDADVRVALYTLDARSQRNTAVTSLLRVLNVARTPAPAWRFGASLRRFALAFAEFADDFDFAPMRQEWAAVLDVLDGATAAHAALRAFIAGPAGTGQRFDIDGNVAGDAGESAAAALAGAAPGVRALLSAYTESLARCALSFLRHLGAAQRATADAPEPPAYEIVRQACSALGALGVLNEAYRADYAATTPPAVAEPHRFTILREAAPTGSAVAASLRRVVERVFDLHGAMATDQMLRRGFTGTATGSPFSPKQRAYALTMRLVEPVRVATVADIAQYGALASIVGDDASTADGVQTVEACMRALIGTLGADRFAVIVRRNGAAAADDDGAGQSALIYRTAPAQWAMAIGDGLGTLVQLGAFDGTATDAVRGVYARLANGDAVLYTRETLATQMADWAVLERRPLPGDATVERLAELERATAAVDARVASLPKGADAVYDPGAYAQLVGDVLERDVMPVLQRARAVVASAKPPAYSAPPVDYNYGAGAGAAHAALWYANAVLLRQANAMGVLYTAARDALANAPMIDTYYEEFAQLRPMDYTVRRASHILVRETMPDTPKLTRVIAPYLVDVATAHVLGADVDAAAEAQRAALLVEKHSFGQRRAKAPQQRRLPTALVAAFANTAADERAVDELGTEVGLQLGYRSAYDRAVELLRKHGGVGNGVGAAAPLRVLGAAASRWATDRFAVAALRFVAALADDSPEGRRLSAAIRTVARRVRTVAWRLAVLRDYERAAAHAATVLDEQAMAGVVGQLVRAAPLAGFAAGLKVLGARFEQKDIYGLSMLSMKAALEDFVTGAAEDGRFARITLQNITDAILGIADAQIADADGVLATDRAKLLDAAYNALVFGALRITFGGDLTIANPDKLNPVASVVFATGGSGDGTPQARVELPPDNDGGDADGRSGQWRSDQSVGAPLEYDSLPQILAVAAARRWRRRSSVGAASSWAFIADVYARYNDDNNDDNDDDAGGEVPSEFAQLQRKRSDALSVGDAEDRLAYLRVLDAAYMRRGAALHVPLESIERVAEASGDAAWQTGKSTSVYFYPAVKLAPQEGLLRNVVDFFTGGRGGDTLFGNSEQLAAFFERFDVPPFLATYATKFAIARSVVEEVRAQRAAAALQ